MRKSGKIMLGLLTIGALVGTAYAAWTVNDKFASVSLTEDGKDIIETTINRSDIGTLVVEQSGTLKFDGINPETKEDLSSLKKTFNIKATTKEGAGLTLDEIYTPTRYDEYASDHQPNIKFSVTMSDTKANASINLFEQYVVLPAEQTISYNVWLNSELKSTGYTFDTAFTYVEHPNKIGIENHPQNFLQDETQLKAFWAAVEDITFTYHFDVVGTI